jgi:quercetin dioxygenase-like cupin family protein
VARSPRDHSTVRAGVARELPVVADATTSRAVVDNDAVRVVLFTFDAGEQLTEHTAAVPVVVQLIRGRLRFELQGEQHELEAGDVVYLAPGAAHALQALEPSMMSLVLVHER